MIPLAAGTTPLGGLLLVLAALIIGVSVWAIFRGMDVRLALMLAALTLAAMAGDLQPITRKFIATFSDEKFVVPICSAMGFAYVLRLTQCDMHLVHLLMRPLQRASSSSFRASSSSVFSSTFPLLARRARRFAWGPSSCR